VLEFLKRKLYLIMRVLLGASLTNYLYFLITTNYEKWGDDKKWNFDGKWECALPVCG
jgi:hypothetical protein